MKARRFSTAFVAAALLLMSGSVVAQTKQHPAYDQMLRAAQHTQRASREIYLVKHRLGLLNQADDVNRTGLLGEEYTQLTTTPGYIIAKRTATNPDFSAYLVRLLREQDLDSGDTVLVTMTGSLPGLNLALLCALETLDIPAFRVASLGASSYGANQLAMTWIDIEDVLAREGLIECRSDLVTLGGTGDIGGGIPQETREELRLKCARLGYPLLEAGNTSEQYEERLALLGDPRGYALLINVGGNHLMLGTGPEGRELPGGFIRPGSDTWQRVVSTHTGGVVFDFLHAGVPVLNLLHVEELAELAGIPVDPTPLPRLGTSPVYFVEIP
ncbi:MAG: poly-gamma-glutamate system protein [bacterium]|nr:poly-gamma-glutamate system protein [bacterium]